MITLKDEIVDKLQNLPEDKLREVLDFVEYLDAKRTNENGTESDPLLAVLGIVSAEPISSKEIDEELYGPLLIREQTGEGEA